ncbi:FadR/GntR family transcriptional regulator [Microbacterium sp. UBA1612]|uniref:FadR/GntR family transcriptional regulator n=1 Tax=unclassified Microbacterium TaxID=2609290 RepID=UPI000E84C369|nr:FCD domain-containing protein [Microbacterium sp. UBA1612]HAS32246.1 GntR family transcriptional regulator [Microbacterium sp.]HBR89938.1 GntR family transcriptional regulator [Microbacterium sp.]|tara:strand:- start:4653 stop:5405 length:753 start_codon:yes stop_codon:yes gene_type:complete
MTASHPTEGLSSLAGLHSKVLDELGAAICAGELPAGSVLTLDDVESTYGISRSVARETVRVLQSMGLAVSRRRVGVVVLPDTEWNLYDPQIIRWRLASPDRAAQLAALVELRAAVEPEAARLAAQRATSAEISDLIALAGKLWAAGEEGDGEAFLALDVQFHARVLLLSRNAMFARLDSLIAQILVSRTEHGLVPSEPDVVALQRHVDVAGAIQRRDGDAAHDLMRSILLQTIDEIDTISDQGDPISSWH